jgi:hypothetical protein
MDKKKRKEIQKGLLEKELVEFKKCLPVDENIFSQLFDFLDNELAEKECNHTTKLTEEFLEKNSVLKISNVIEWLADNGGYCDCEVLANVEDLFDYLKKPIKHNSPKNTIKRQKLNSLATDFGFCIEKIPSPWTLIETISGFEKIYKFQIGKSNNCIVTLVPEIPEININNDIFWKDKWIKETELVNNINDLTVERLEFNNYYAILVKTKNWTPVKIWCIKKENNNWHLKMNTELSRYKGDIKELEKLTNYIITK